MNIEELLHQHTGEVNRLFRWMIVFGILILLAGVGLYLAVDSPFTEGFGVALISGGLVHILLTRFWKSKFLEWHKERELQTSSGIPDTELASKEQSFWEMQMKKSIRRRNILLIIFLLVISIALISSLQHISLGLTGVTSGLSFYFGIFLVFELLFQFETNDYLNRLKA